MHRSVRAITLSSLALLMAIAARADEGMWTFDNLPIQKMKAKYGFAPDQVWLDHVRLSSVRFPGGSGSFISKDGLVLTNHHVGHQWIQAVSDPQHDFVKDGFVAPDRSREIKVPGLALFTLMEMENITDRIDKVAQPGMDEQAAAQAKSSALAMIVKEQNEKSGLVCQPVSLYQGGQTWIYRYKKHTDVRLVMAPEYGVAAFGKEWDNFTWPRHDLDFSLFRVYENNKPYMPAHFLVQSKQGVAYGEMTFTVGFPGRTSRLETVSQMEARRDVLNPLMIRSLDRKRAELHAIAAQGEEKSRQVSAEIMTTENSYKVISSEMEGLRDKAAMAKVAAAEKDLRAKVASDPKLTELAGQSWTKIEEALERQKAIAQENANLESLDSESVASRRRENQEKQKATQSVISEHLARIAKARFAVYGMSAYPDGTSTLRLSFGAIETYPLAGTLAQPFTTFAGLFDRAASWGPTAEAGSWELPSRWLKRRDNLNLFTPYNFISTNDIIGGNSGSPVLNKQGELVGLAFDGNIESIPGRYYYDSRVNRCLSVDARAIVEALRKVYDAGHLVKEIKGE